MIVVSGEALMDVFAQDETPAGLALDARVGGSPLNVAVGLARLAQPVAFFGALSSGFLGQRLRRHLRAEGVDTSCTAEVDAPTTLGVVGLGADGGPSYEFYGDGAADRQLPASALSGVPAAAACYHFGSYAMVVEPVATTTRALVERESGRSVIAYDPNVRLQVEPDRARWRDALAWMLPRAQLLKLSEDDLALLHPGAAADELAPRWLGAGVALVVLTRGARGARAWTSRARVDVAAAAVDVVDTVGAGDAFQAALLCTLAECGALSRAGLHALDAPALRRALQFAASAAAIACARRGADLARRHELG